MNTDTGFVKSQFDVLRDAYLEEMYPSLAQRTDRLKRLKAMLIENEDDLCASVSSDFGYRSPKQTSFAEITTTLKSINHSLKHLKYWMAPVKRTPDLPLRLSGAKALIHYQPKGVVGIVSPWNFPINLALSPLVSALSAGNRAYIKPSELTPESSGLLKTLIDRYFTPEEVAVICGDVDVAKTFVELPFDHLIYTGGEKVAKSIMQSASNNLVPLTLELGGKSPVVVGDGANLNYLAEKIAFGKYFNAGQVCIAPDYLLIKKDLVGEFIKNLNRKIVDMDSSNTASDKVSVLNEIQARRLDALTENSSDLENIFELVSPKENGYRLTVIVNPKKNAEILTQEIFGPVLLVRTVDKFDEMINLVNKNSSPLVIYYFGGSKDEFKKLLKETKSGGLVKNDVIFQYANDDLPFGGVGGSGMGRYRGEHGFKEFSNCRAVYKAGYIDTSGLITPPYTGVFEFVNKLMRRVQS